MKQLEFALCCLTLCGGAAETLAAGERTDDPVLMMRVRSNDTASRGIWKANLKALAAHPGCCDEIWFSTGIGAPDLSWHRANAAVIAEATRDVRALGILSSLQFQATLGHGDGLVTPEAFARKTWTGWTDRNGVETRYCNCPRQPAFLAYLREVASVYAKIGFASLWIDDDLRITNHLPADNSGRFVGCWCPTCLAAFNAETKANWTRAALAKAVAADEALAARWRAFSIGSLCGVARTIAETFVRESPGTMMALQHAYFENNVDQVSGVLSALHATSGRPVGFRPGGGVYGDDDRPIMAVTKSVAAGWFRNYLGDPAYVKVWTPEIESHPRTYYSRSDQSILVEGFAALMSGLNAVSFFISNSAKEDPELYGRTFWRVLAEGAPVLKGYARAIAGCRAVGFSAPAERDGTVRFASVWDSVSIRRAAIPVLAGGGIRCGELTKEEVGRRIREMTSAEVQDFREALDRRAGGLPAVVCSPFVGLMQPHVDADGALRTVALLSARIADQGPVRLRLAKLPAGATRAVWNEMRKEPVSLPVERAGEASFVTVPKIDAWNGGYVSFP